MADWRIPDGAESILGSGGGTPPGGGLGDPLGEIARILDVLGREAAQSDPSSRRFIERAVELLEAPLARRETPPGAPGSYRGLAGWQVKRVTAYMREHLAEEINLDELAALIKLSRFYFCTAFRQATGRTPHAWLIEERIAQGRELLADPSLRITDVALAVGYQTPSAFSARFRRLTGVTPTEYRRRL
ncbi:MULTISPECIES: AraC family transcriptional regulator [Rhodomicrobium]|uniref:helix-turn-helix domain-containing protein n=1 Tax=Rhodomicrobium TaxID=1068 RepID=UPI001FD92F47|nr:MULTISPECIES: AraC family transcriptional regulator [Rhodomicrobium]